MSVRANYLRTEQKRPRNLTLYRENAGEGKTDGSKESHLLVSEKGIRTAPCPLSGVGVEGGERGGSGEPAALVSSFFHCHKKTTTDLYRSLASAAQRDQKRNLGREAVPLSFSRAQHFNTRAAGEEVFVSPIRMGTDPSLKTPHENRPQTVNKKAPNA